MANASDEEQKLIRRLEAARERLVAATPSAGRGPLTPEQVNWPPKTGRHEVYHLTLWRGL